MVADRPADWAALGALCTTCWSTPTLEVQQFADRFLLTRRELQVARCTAIGSGNRDIATHLDISIRTVEGHLLRACQKLGVRGRVRVALLLSSLDQGALTAQHRL